MLDDKPSGKIKKLPYIAIWSAKLIVLYVGGFYLFAWYSRLIAGWTLIFIFLGLLATEEGLRRLKKKYPQESHKVIFGEKPENLPAKPLRFRVVGMALLFFIFFLCLICYIFLMALRVLPAPYSYFGFILIAILGTFWHIMGKKYPREYRYMSGANTSQTLEPVELQKEVKNDVLFPESPIPEGDWKKRNKYMAIVLMIFVFLQVIIIVLFSSDTDLTPNFISWAIDIYIIYSLLKQQNVLKLLVWRTSLSLLVWGGQNLIHGNWLDLCLQLIYSAYFIILAATKPTKLKTVTLSILVIPIYLIVLVSGIIYLTFLK